MTTVTVDFKEATRTIYFNPTLPPAKGVQTIGTTGLVRGWGVLCDIVDPLSSYSIFGRSDFGPSQLLSVSWSSEYPIVRTKESRDPINSIKITIMDKEGKQPTKNVLGGVIVCLKIYH